MATLRKGTNDDVSIHRKFTAGRERGPLWPRLKIAMIVYIGLVHVVGIYGLAVVLTGGSTPSQLLWMGATYLMSLLGITAGAHRLWSHKSYKATPVMKAILLVFSSISNQGTVYHWARDHRVHHKFSELDADPHNANRGFFFAHMGWLFVEKDPEVAMAGKMLDLSDLDRDLFLQIQKRLNPVWNLGFCFLLPALAPLLWGDDMITTNLLLAVARYLVSLHVTWCVNSFAHFFGGHPYDEHSGPAENPVVAILSIGEGWHNWHHKYPFDYAASELGISAQFNPTKLFLDTCASFGIVYDRRRQTHLWAKRQEAILHRMGDGAKSVVSGPPLFKQRHIMPATAN